MTGPVATGAPPATVPAPPGAAAALLVSGDDLLVAEVARLAAAAGCPLEVVHDLGAALRGWGRAPTVLVGEDRVTSLAGCTPARRPEVHAVARGAAPDTLFRAALDLGATSVLELPAAGASLVAMLTDVADEAGTATGTTVAVVGGGGGLGATVLAVALATVASRRTAPALLVDLDPWGPGLGRVAGLDRRPEVTWRDLAVSSGRLGARSLRDALAGEDGLGLLGWAGEPAALPPPTLVREVLSAAGRGHRWVVVDLPRRDEAIAAEVLPRCDHVAVVAGASVGSVAATARVAAWVTAHTDSVGLVVRTRRGGLEPEDVAQAVSLPLLSALPGQRRLDEHLDLGVGPVHSPRSPLARTAARLLDRWEEQR